MKTACKPRESMRKGSTFTNTVTAMFLLFVLMMMLETMTIIVVRQ